MSDLPHDVSQSLDRLATIWTPWWSSQAAQAHRQELADRFLAAVDAWQLRRLQAFTSGQMGLVVAAERGGVPVVVKLSPLRGLDAAGRAAEASVLAALADADIGPALLDARDEHATVLLARVQPGTSLASSPLGLVDKARVLGDLARAMAQTPAPAGLPRFDDSGLIAHWQAMLAGHPAQLAELADLLASTPRRTLVHGDFHGENVLAGSGGWQVIDPKPTVGDPHADIYGLLFPAFESVGEDAFAQSVAVFSEAAGLHPERVMRWVRFRAELYIACTPDNARVELKAWADELRRLLAQLPVGA